MAANGTSTKRPHTDRQQTAPAFIMNGHFATSDASSKEHYEHGVQIIDGDKNFKYVV